MSKPVALLVMLAALLLSQTAAAAASDTGGILNDVTDEFLKASAEWAATIAIYATRLFWTLAAISLVWTFGFMAMRKADIGEFFAEFIKFIIFTGFYLWLLRNGPDFAISIIRSLMQVGSEAGGVDELNPSTPVTIGFQIIAKASKSISIFKPGDSLAIVLVCLIILLCLAAVAANVLMVLVTAWIMAYAGMFVLGFGGSRWTSDIAIGYFRSVAGIALKLLTMTLMIGIATSVMKKLLDRIDGGASVEQLLVPCVVSFVLALLIHTLPNIIAGLIPGGGGAASAAGSFSAGAIAGAGMQAASTAARVASATASGGMSAVTGMAGMAKGMMGGAQSMYSAFKGMSSATSGGAGMVSQLGGLMGGGGSGGGSNAGGGGSSPLGGAMGLSSLGGGGASAMASMASAMGQASGGGSGDSGDSGGSASGGGEQSGSSQSGSAELGGSSGGGEGNGGGDGAGASSAPAEGGRSATSASSAASNAGASSMSPSIGAETATSGGGKQGGTTSASTPTGSGGAAATSSKQSAPLDTRSTSRSFDPSAEVASFAKSKKT
ncbi:P-type conjugative transfer protein TrbL [Pseudomonas fulva]|uniref:P-type conjugative transfer protein TrbL n=1 Tax=Pseudomonas fulva TaxID=47880 RepID=UPI0018AB79AB|nr:P-type conjugative transfer protein TrbL [Pseudomonas fulva]MBF8774834.1 P-type conjugative transfer protein TrbL [Pseudomonas fulva]